MSNSTRSPGGRKKFMKEYEFTCSECGQEIAVNENMRSAIVSNGCPVCTASVSDDEFGEE